MDPCVIRAEATCARGVLCEVCAGTLGNGSQDLCPEQIVELVVAVQQAWLIDAWGIPHALGAHNVLGRNGPFAIRSAVVSRHHSVVEKAGSRWLVHDLCSSTATSNRRMCS